MAALSAAQAGSLGILEGARLPAEAGESARRSLDQTWQRARERAVISALARTGPLHTAGAPSHATLHPVASGIPCPTLAPVLLYK